MKYRLAVIIISLAAFTACQPQQRRYQLMTGQNIRAIKIDADTGQSWSFDGGTMWEPITDKP
jgi:hypothetical protein